MSLRATYVARQSVPPKKTQKIMLNKRDESRGNLGKNTHKPVPKINHRLGSAFLTYIQWFNFSTFFTNHQARIYVKPKRWFIFGTGDIL